MSESLQELLPLEISAPSPNNKDQQISLRIDRELVQNYADIGAKTELYQLFYNVCGLIPPVNNIGYHEELNTQGTLIFPDASKGLESSSALFRGLRRPCFGQEGEKDVFIYIVNPTYVYEYVPHMVCMAKRELAPENAVLAVYVVFDDDQLIKGKVVQFELVRADQNRPHLPKDYINRYDKQIW
ncbi:hypothetical protein ACJJIE_13255 [Microbulbifer sp. TRSA001]|uniref:hypothetical protein n=1 Tax=Microbulbifer sp. TRSA001 TaxID=3243381 RepID=UPI00403A0B50